MNYMCYGLDGRVTGARFGCRIIPRAAHAGPIEQRHCRTHGLEVEIRRESRMVELPDFRLVSLMAAKTGTAEDSLDEPT